MITEAEYRHIVKLLAPFSINKRSDAEDATQEAICRILASGNASRDPVAHIYVIGLRVMLDMCRRQNIAKKHWPLLVREPDTTTPETILTNKMRHRALHVAFASLTPQERRCLMGRAEGLKLREIGEREGIRLQRVAEIVAGAVRTLQRRICLETRTHGQETARE